MQLLVVNEVRAHRIQNQVKEYLIHWDGFESDSEDTWESEKYLSCDEKISLFWSRFRHNKNHDAGPWIPPVDPLIPVLIETPPPSTSLPVKSDGNAKSVPDIRKRKKRQKKERSKKKEGEGEEKTKKKSKKLKKESSETKKKEKKERKDKGEKKKRFKPTAETTTDDAYQRNEFEGVTCHQCRQKTTDTKAICINNASHAFCAKCLRNRYNVNLEELQLHQKAWVCPRCTDECNCSICRKKQGKPPLLTRKAGQKNV